VERLLRKIEALKKGEAGARINGRISEFKALGEKGDLEIFKELCFCILTANFDAKRAIRIQEDIKDGFFTLSEDGLKKRLKELGYRFPNIRASFIVKAREHKDGLRKILREKKGQRLREHFEKNVKGLGIKESSHFLRNVGVLDFAIVDFHIVDLLEGYGLFERPKSMTRKKYLEAERVLGEIAERAGLSQGELDMYLWYIETGKILK
jgi:N-glycosylase/DNA lyase